jgi:hypothetical protein
MMDNLYSGEESPLGDENRESFEERLLSGGGGGGEEIVETEQRLYDFHKAIEKVK